MTQHRSLWNQGWKRRDWLGITARTLALPAAFWVGALVGQSSHAQTPAPRPTPSDLNRVAPGTPAPAIELPDATGSRRTLASFRGAPAVLVFYRGSW